MSDVATMVGHGVLGMLSVWTIVTLHRHGIKFDIRIWRNGKHKEDK